MWGKGSRAGVDWITAPIKPDRAVEGHPCPKPLLWATKLLGLFPAAESVLDPFVGSGTVLVAARELGMKAVGIDINEDYCNIAVNRLGQLTFEVN